jgi:hypothetical protein
MTENKEILAKKAYIEYTKLQQLRKDLGRKNCRAGFGSTLLTTLSLSKGAMLNLQSC